jgi:ribosomal protein S17E
MNNNSKLTYNNSINNLENKSILEDIFDNIADTFEHNEYIYIILFIIGCVVFIIGIKIHFDAYESMYVPIKAMIIDATCEKHAVNRRRNENYCTINLGYEINSKKIKNIIQTYGTTTYRQGDLILIYVDKENPLNIYVPYMSHTLQTLLLCTCGVLIILITLSARFLHV